MITDLQLKQRVLERLELEPKIDPAALGVTVENGVVTLRGSVENERDRVSAERAVRVIKGVKGVIGDELRVNAGGRVRTGDPDLEAAAREAVQWLTTAPQENIKVNVQDAWVILQGEVETLHQAQCLEAVLRGVPGVHGVRNELRVVRSVA